MTDKKLIMRKDMYMKILVVSDTHGYNTNLFRLLDKIKPIDMLIHCGDSDDLADYIDEFVDCPVVMVRGNCDMCSRLKGEEVVDIAGHRIFVTHGHTYGVKSGLNSLIDKAESVGADIALYGHSHIPDLTYMRGISVFNPGSISMPRQEGRKCTYGIIEISDDGKKAYCSLHTI